MSFFLTLVLLVVTLGLTWRYLGSYMAAVFDGRVHFLKFVERPIYRLLGTSPEQEQTWKRYAGVSLHLRDSSYSGLVAA
jgi:K+-transporting ATPase ATPase A chain